MYFSNKYQYSMSCIECKGEYSMPEIYVTSNKQEKIRSKYKCINYRKDGSCGYVRKCKGASQCTYYEEENLNDRNKSNMGMRKSNIKVEPFSGIRVVPIELLHRGHDMRPPKSGRLNVAIDYYEKNHCFDKPVYVEIENGKYYIKDKYLRYCAAKKLGLKEIQIRFGGKKQSKYDDSIIRIGARVRHDRWGNGTVKKANFDKMEITFDSGKVITFVTLLCIDEKKIIPLLEDVDKISKQQDAVTNISFEKTNPKEDYEQGDTFCFHIKENSDDNEKYYEIKKIEAENRKEHCLRFSASGINNLYELLKNSRALFEQEAARNLENKHEKEVASGEFTHWSATEIDFKPTVEKNTQSQINRVRKETQKEKKLYEIKERVKNKSSFDEYKGMSDRLMAHQKAACEIARQYSHFAFFYDTGTGKTVLALEIMACKYAEEQQRFLVICPKPIIKTAWMNDQNEFYPKMKLLPLSKNISLDDLKRLNNRWNSIDRESIFHDKLYYDDWEFDKTKQQQYQYIQAVLIGKAEHYIVNGQTFVREYDSFVKLRITGLIVDESAVLKNYDSKLTQKVREFAKQCKSVYLLSGKPAPNTSCEYFSQMKIVDPETFSMSYKAFRAKYYYNDNGRLKLKSYLQNELFEKIAKSSIIVSKTECIDLPDTSHVIRKFELPEKIMQKYNQMCNNLIAVFEQMDKESEGKKVNKVFESNNRLSSMMKLREITSGFIKDSSGISSHIDASKENALLELVDEIGNNQIIIWCQFKYEIEHLADILIKSGKRVVTAFSGTINLDMSIERFKNGYADILIAHPMTLQYGVTLVNCCFAIYYSMSYSFEQYEQSYARIYRKGQRNYCSYYFLQAEDTIDEDIYTCVMQKKRDVETCEYLLKSITEHGKQFKKSSVRR